MFETAEFEKLKKDVNRRMIKFQQKSLRWKIQYYWKNPQYRTLLLYRLSHSAKPFWVKSFFGYFYNKHSQKYGLEILTPHLGGGVIMPHWGRIVLNANAIGDDLYVFHNVTIGNDYVTGRPRIGNNVFIGVNSVILGKITIGDNVVIGAGSCVLEDVPSNSLVAGNPAKIIKSIEPGYIQKMIKY